AQGRAVTPLVPSPFSLAAAPFRPVPRLAAALPLAALLLLLLLLLPHAAAAQAHYIAFGDSITAGYGDDPGRARPGYPPRLESLLAAHGTVAVVDNQGFFGETTDGGLTRLNRVLQGGGDVLLLMEGTNDVNQKISAETTLFNLDTMARKAEAQGMKVVHATIIPRLPSANTDGDNRVTEALAEGLRDLAWTRGRALADPFEVFFYYTPNVFNRDYLDGVDRLHPNGSGYERLARVFADFLLGIDSVPPVTGTISPADGALGVAPNATVSLSLYDFGKGIDISKTVLQVGGQTVTPALSGDSRKLVINYTPATPFQGVVSVALQSQDLASPPNQLDRTLATFIIAGTTFLPGDINHDGRVDGTDLLILALAFGAHRSDPNYNIAADFNGDGIVDGLDLAVVAANFGKSSF
nr:GDSL-type esterase/lipase family protein [Acidobacteriota bacterium]